MMVLGPAAYITQAVVMIRAASKGVPPFQELSALTCIAGGMLGVFSHPFSLRTDINLKFRTHGSPWLHSPALLYFGLFVFKLCSMIVAQRTDLHL